MKKSLISAGIAVLGSLAAYPAQKSINFNPLLTGMNSSYLGLEDASLNDQAFSQKRTPGRMFFYGTYHWDHEPWIIMSEDRRKEVEPIVSQMHTVDMGFSWLLTDSLQLSVDGFGSMVGVAKNYGGYNDTHMGDSRIQLKWRFFTDTDWNMALAPEFTIPTGVGYIGHPFGSGLSNSSYAPGLRFIGEYGSNQNQVTVNIGYTYYDKAEFKFPNQNYPRIDGRSRVFLGTGWLHRLSKHWALDTELSAQVPAGVSHFTPPGLFSMGGRYQPGKTVSWHFGLGTGSLGAPGGNDPVVYAGVKIPFFGSDKKEDANNQDPLTQPVQKRSATENFDDYAKLDSREVDPLLTAQSAEPETKPLYTQEELEQKVIYQKQRIQVLDEVEFDLNMSHLTRRGRQIVHQVAKIILDHKRDIEHVNVDGHTDHQGNDRINDPLSQARAETVRNELIAQGVAPYLLTATGYGSHKPIYDYHTNPKSLWEKNRRVEFNITQPR